MQILNALQIEQKVTRLAFEILEDNYQEQKLILVGINTRGMLFARKLMAKLEEIGNLPIELVQLKIDPANPLAKPCEVDSPMAVYSNEAIIIVDDVANTGRTLFYAFQPFYQILPKKIQIAVLVDRKHKTFPVLVDFVGLSLATTLKEHIEVTIEDGQLTEANLN
ncbi:MAG: phosphoribosyltransferase family protein [Saprospiraceae bacterium]